MGYYVVQLALAIDDNHSYLKYQPIMDGSRNLVGAKERLGPCYRR